MKKLKFTVGMIVLCLIMSVPAAAGGHWYGKMTDTGRCCLTEDTGGEWAASINMLLLREIKYDLEWQGGDTISEDYLRADSKPEWTSQTSKGW
jgi:hypothetical protein